jgi:hypothetical protein
MGRSTVQLTPPASPTATVPIPGPSAGLRMQQQKAIQHIRQGSTHPVEHRLVQALLLLGSGVVPGIVLLLSRVGVACVRGILGKVVKANAWAQQERGLFIWLRWERARGQGPGLEPSAAGRLG